MKPVVKRLPQKCWFPKSTFTLSLELLHSLPIHPPRCSVFIEVFVFSKQWSYSTGHRNSSLDPGSSRQRLRPPRRRDRPWHPVIPHKHWTADPPADHGHLYVRLSACSRQLLPDGFTWFPPKFSRPYATTTSNGKRKTDHERYGEKSPYQAPDRRYYSNAVRFDPHISWWGKKHVFIHRQLFYFVDVFMSTCRCVTLNYSFVQRRCYHLFSSVHVEHLFTSTRI